MALDLTFVEGRMNHPEVKALLRHHLSSAAEHSPPESRHALNLDGLTHPDVTFWSVWEKEALLGFCALKALDAEHGEIKSMRVADAHQRRGVADAMMTHLIEASMRSGHQRLSLETGSMAAFDAARRLYAKHGFEPCAPFAEYTKDPNSVCLSRRI